MKIARLGDNAGRALLLVAAAVIAIRLPIGIDLSDESYYAIFLDDWLKGGIATSTLLTLHQTAALLLFPFAYLYVAISGSTDGLFLALRIVFFLGSSVTAAIWVLFLRRLGAGAAAYVTGAAIISFIPFGLPAPSYNSIGQQGLMIALAALGLAALSSDPRKEQRWAYLSAVAAAISSVAYPPMTLAVVALILLPLPRPVLAKPAQFVLATMAAGVLAWATVLWALTPQRLWDSVVYLAAINDPAGFEKKILFSLNLAKQNPAFLGLCTTAMALGYFRPLLPAAGASLATAGMLLLSYALPPILFSKSHDVVTLAILLGLPLLSGFKAKASAAERTVALMYASSLVAAAATTAAATFAIYNTCIGGLPAAVLAVAAPRRDRTSTAITFGAAPALAMLPSLFATSLMVPYGEIPSKAPRYWIREGFFKGIKAKERDTTPLVFMKDKVEPLFLEDRTLAVFARLPGLALASSARIKALTSFPLMPDVPEGGLSATRAFYAERRNQPAIVVIYHDPYLETVNPMGDDFPNRYREEFRLKTSLGELMVFRRR